MKDRNTKRFSAAERIALIDRMPVDKGFPFAVPERKTGSDNRIRKQEGLDFVNNMLPDTANKR